MSKSSEQVQAEVESIVAAKAQRLSVLNSRMDNGFWDWELAGDSQWYSTRLVSLLDYEIEGDFANEVVRLLAQTSAVSAVAAQNVTRCLAEHQDFDERLNILEPSGLPIWIRLRGAASIDATGSAYFAGSLEDISDRVLLETERKRFAEELERSNSELESFANVASHDLRAPLRHISELTAKFQNSINRLDGEQTLSQQTGYVAEIRTRIDLMDRLLTGLLDYARVGRAKDRVETIDLNVLLGDVLRLLAPPGEFSIELVCSAAPLRADPVVIQQCVRNFLDNAIKHASPSKPRVRIEAFDTNEYLKIFVHDNGAGIPEHKRQKVFGLFETLEQPRSTKGAGMGLAIVDKAIRANGGSVEIVNSALGGACFQLSWPKINNRTKT